ncbi:protein kinase subdomain-containing protein PKL/CAK/Fmp29 [Lentinus brumalis]|uniref:Protein kinase subdomain-containing protein PKL/CAK/Fmp29 n=1 Tax=Lentinus brumalis TaxID=2498619 RepID=A0A371DJR0_9APHY|nr:protein kinase subdomain-containing protein PKL/CAK/Fmp29 [Polyporus brumalis]
MVHSRNDLFDYTSGRWLINDALRHAERRRVFNIDGLRRLAAQSVDRSPDDIVDFAKLPEGGFNRTFLITMRDGFQMVARIPYPATVPKYFAVASEVATMTLLRLSGLPIPQVYGYSPTLDNAAETEYIFMEFVRGTNLSNVWAGLEEREINSVLRQLTHLESKMMSITFPGGGSLYYAQDLEKMAGGPPGVPLEDERFCVGPDTRLPLWFGRRSQLDVDRGPYDSAETALVKGAHKELSYLQQFGQPLLPFQRMRRAAYQYQEQQPSAHIENLHRYLLIAPSLVPRDPTLAHFRIRHPDIQPSNIIVSRSPDSKWQIIGLIDWQHASILPVSLVAGIPQRLQNYDDPISQLMTPPSLPENLEDLDNAEQSRARELYHRRLVHYHYVKNTEECNKLHHAALNEPAGTLRRRLFDHASEPWEGETLALKVALIEAAENWKTLTGDDAPCPVVFDAEDVRETMKLVEVQRGKDEILEAFNNMFGLGPEGWVPTDHYEEVVARSRQIKEDGMAAAESEEERTEIATHWPFDDMDEEKYT